MYTVYMHIFPNNKKYIGVSREKLEKRFGLNGNGYRSKLMKEKIQKYGWNNIEHKILKTNLSYEKAIKYEKYYIEKYKSNNINYGYNKNKGGGFNKSMKSYIHITTPNRQKWYNSLKNTHRTEEDKNKVRLGHLKRLNRTILQYENDLLIKEWNSVCEIQKELGYDKTYIGKCCNYNKDNFPYKKAYNYIWIIKNKGE